MLRGSGWRKKVYRKPGEWKWWIVGEKRKARNVFEYAVRPRVAAVFGLSHSCVCEKS